MRLTLYSDFALRTLIFLAVADEHGATIPQIASAYAISENHLRKVVGSLIEAGLVEATRGRGGGLRLAVPPSQIPLGAVVRKLENDFALAECMGVNPENCVITGRCGLQGILGAALNAFFQTLDRYTLADAIRGSRGVRQALGLQNADPNNVAH